MLNIMITTTNIDTKPMSWQCQIERKRKLISTKGRLIGTDWAPNRSVLCRLLFTEWDYFLHDNRYREWIYSQHHHCTHKSQSSCGWEQCRNKPFCSTGAPLQTYTIIQMNIWIVQYLSAWLQSCHSATISISTGRRCSNKQSLHLV